MGRVCEVCGREIARARVEALPETKRCIKCAREKGSDIRHRRVSIGMDRDTYRDLLRALRS